MKTAQEARELHELYKNPPQTYPSLHSGDLQFLEESLNKLITKNCENKYGIQAVEFYISKFTNIKVIDQLINNAKLAGYKVVRQNRATETILLVSWYKD